MDRPVIELVYFAGCPHVEAARTALRAALEVAGLPAAWREWDQAQPGVPERVMGYGSPTVLVDGMDITGNAPENVGLACRADGVPSSAALQLALIPWMQPDAPREGDRG